MLKFKVTNISKLPQFLVEAGRLLQPNDNVAVNRLDETTKQDKTKWKVEEGGFKATASPVKPKQKEVDDEEPNHGISPAKVVPGPGSLVTTTKTKRVVPLQAVEKEEAEEPTPATAHSPSSAEGGEEDVTLTSDSKPEDLEDGEGFKDELDDEVAKAAPFEGKPEETPSTFATRPGLPREGGVS